MSEICSELRKCSECGSDLEVCFEGVEEPVYEVRLAFWRGRELYISDANILVCQAEHDKLEHHVDNSAKEIAKQVNDSAFFAVRVNNCNSPRFSKVDEICFLTTLKYSYLFI